MMIPLPKEVRSLFMEPFRSDGDYIWDRQCHMVADRGDGYRWDSRDQTTDRLAADPMRPRGWGRIQYLPDAERRYDMWVAWFDANFGARQTDIDAVVAALNAAWEVP